MVQRKKRETDILRFTAKHKKKPIRRWKRILLIILAIFAVIVLAAFLIPPIVIGNQASNLILPPLETASNSTLLASDGKTVIGHVAASDVHTELTDSQVPDLIKQAHMAAEDRDFYEHGAVSTWGTARAIITDATDGSWTAGGSTITQQYVKNTYLTMLPKGADRKYNEWLYAYKVEQTYSKDHILTMYVNSNYYGRGAYGVEDGAEAWFGVPATQLSNMNDPLQVARAAMLAALINKPSSFADYKGEPSNLINADGPNGLWARTTYVLDGFHQLGGVNAHVAQSVVDQAKALLPLQVTNTIRPSGQPSDGDPYLVAYVRDWLIAWQTQLALEDGFNSSDAQSQGATTAQAMLARGGLQIVTSIEPTVQQYLNDAVSIELPPKGLSTGAIILNPYTGGVAAMYGGYGYSRDSYNYALYANRQVGSVMKSVVLADAVSQGISVQSVLPAPAYIEMNGSQIWNDDHTAAPGCQLSIKDGVAESNNPVNVEIITGKMASCDDPSRLTDIESDYPVSPQSVADLAHQMGADDSTVPDKTSPAQLDAVPTLALGVSSLTPLKVASIGATLASGGIHNTPYIISNIEGFNGSLLYEHQIEPNRVLNTGTVNIVNQTLTGVFTYGTATSAQVPGHPLAGKTGTTQSDAWGMAYNALDPSGNTPAYVCSTWAGYPDNRQTNGDLWGASVIKVCQQLFKRVLSGLPTVNFAPVDMSAGKLVGLSH